MTQGNDRLKLGAADEDDLAVISAVLQDALAPVAEMAFLPEEQRFALVVNRFRWERAPDGSDGSGTTAAERTLAAVTFEGVSQVRMRGFRHAEKERILSILAIRLAKEGPQIDFSGDASLLLVAPALACRVEDIGEPWPTLFRPAHPEA